MRKPSQFLMEKLEEMFSEDAGFGDVTSQALIEPGIKASAEIVARKSGILAGVAEAVILFERRGVKVNELKNDGARIKRGQILMWVRGPAREILATERVALNLLMRMSGIATATRELVDRARRRNPQVTVAATRKTAPLLTRFDKRAVAVAGGKPHRYNLGEQILIKDNHLKLVGSIEEAVRNAKRAGKGKVEIEISDPKDVLQAVKAGADIVMLDNMTPAQVKRVVETLGQGGAREKVVLEVSGGIDPSNIGKYAATGVDIISTSHMTMRAPALDMSLEMKKKDN